MHNSIADSVYNDIMSKGSNYYYFLGKTLAWTDENNPPYPIDSYGYEHDTRNEIITMKQIKTSDVAYVVLRHNWLTGTVYDQFDDQYSTEVQGVDLSFGGTGYVTAPTVSFSGTGTGAVGTCTILNGAVTSVTMTNKGSGYTSAPAVSFVGTCTTPAAGTAVVTMGVGGVQKLESTTYYVLTSDYNVYVCIDNNSGAASTVQPYGTTVETITTSDGYIWKFLYNIPTSLRNKFLTDVYMPVITALQQQFYSNGNIQTVNIDSRGSGYTFGSITVSGDGYLESDPVYVTSAAIQSAGTGYTTATIAISPPFSNSTAWVASSAVILNQIILYNNNFYKVVVPGTLSAVAPTHTSGTVTLNTASLQYIGTNATGTVGLSGGAINSVTLNRQVSTISITNGGSGYTSAPAVTFSGSGGAVGTAVLQNGTLIDVKITSIGSYTTTPTVAFGTLWVSGGTATINSQVYFGNNLYTVTAGSGTFSATAPTHTSGSVVNGGYTLAYAGVVATGTVNMKSGAGYSSTPSVTITGNGTLGNISVVTTPSSARLLPVISSGQVTGIQILDGGIGYSYANITITGDGTGAQLTPVLSVGDVNTIQANVELLTVSGQILNIPVISGGYNYVTAAVAVTGDGTGCTATATLVNGRVKKINIVNPGYGYTWATVIISGSGYGAKARAVISPYGGHGKNALNQLYARNLMMFSDISNDKNQGFTVNNDFRQIGIIRNPYRYGTTYIATAISNSACWVVSGTISQATFTPDMLLRHSATGGRFRIVTNTGTAVLLQSLDNITPSTGDTFYNDANSGQTFSATGIALPTIDKYSGDLLYIDNKQAFTPTAQQAVTLRTVISF